MRPIISLLALLAVTPATVSAQGISKDMQQKLGERNTVYVNTKAPGVHKEYDSSRGEYVWKSSNGNYLCKDENMKPLEDIDKDYHFTGANNDPDNPKVNSPLIKKEWDEERGSYVWKDNMGNFLGRDKASADKQKEWLSKEDNDWLENGSIPKKKTESNALAKAKSSAGAKNKSTASKGDDNTAGKDDTQGDNNKVAKGGTTDWDNLDNLTEEQIRNLVITSDEQLAIAEKGLREARAAIAQAKGMGVNVGDYADLSALDAVEKAINEYKRNRNRIK